MKHGGKREGAGRKPSPDKKIKVDLYIRASIIEKVGGMNAIKEDLYSYSKNFVSDIFRCPFCSDYPKVKKVNEIVSYVECSNDFCDVQPYCEGDNIQDAINKWNIRAT